MLDWAAWLLSSSSFTATHLHHVPEVEAGHLLWDAPPTLECFTPQHWAPCRDEACHDNEHESSD